MAIDTNASVAGPDCPGIGSRETVVLVAAWLGLMTGLMEGIGSTLLRIGGGLTWEMQLEAPTTRVIWFAPLLYIMVFLILGGLLILVGYFLSPHAILRASMFSFVLLFVIDLLSLPGRLNGIGVLVLAVGITSTFLRWFSKHPEVTLAFMRKTLLWIVAVTLLAMAGVEGGGLLRERWAISALPKAAPGTPNVLLIILDALRADHISAYGYGRKTSPTMDALAGEGVLFERAISTSSWTLPSHASILTGRYPHEHGANYLNRKYDGKFPTLPEVLRDHGYRTGGFSGNTAFFSRTQRFDRGFVRFEDSFSTPDDMVVRTFYGRRFWRHVLRPLGWEDVPGRKSADAMTRAALRWIGASKDKPFFVMINYFDVHDPYLPPQPYRSKFSTLPNPGGRINGDFGRDYSYLTAEELQGEVDAYDGAVRYIDKAISDLLSELHNRGVLDNTVVIVTSDHGESLGERGLFIHATALYREQIHVPLIIRWPGHLPAGRRVQTPVSGAAVAATILDLAGQGAREQFPVPSLIPLCQGDERGRYTGLALSELDQMSHGKFTHVPNYDGAIRSIVAGRWHYIVHTKFGEELFDWERDPAETTNLANTSEGRNTCEEFSRLLNRTIVGVPNSKSAGLN